MISFPQLYSKRPLLILTIALLTALLIGQQTPTKAAANAIRGGFNTGQVPASDDDSSPAANLGFTINFYGLQFSQIFVNNNGNVTLDAASTNFTPFDLTSTGRKIIAPFFADVDTRASGLVTYGQGTVDGRPAFGATWTDVGYFMQGAVNVNSFQVVIIDRSDIGPGDFDFEFNYNTINWEAGDANGGVDGIGGTSARAGYSNGTGAPGTAFELPGSAVNGAFLDSSASGLANNSLNSPVLGRYLFTVRNGQVTVDPGVTGDDQPVVLQRLEDTCHRISALSGEAYLIDVQPETVPGGAVHCRPINNSGRYVQNPGEIGIDSVINAGVLQAVDIYGIMPDARSIVPFDVPVRACLRGEGRMLFLSAADSQRFPIQLNAFQHEDYTCADLTNAGTVVLIENEG